MIGSVLIETRFIMVVLSLGRYCQSHAASIGIGMEAIPKPNASIRRPRHWIQCMEES